MLHSYCLETHELPIDHTMDWNIREKLNRCTTNKGRNIVNAMKELDLLNFPSLGHTLQLSVKKLFDIHAVLKMLSCVRRLVNHVHKSTKSTYKLVEKQQLLDLPQHKLKCDCITWWESTYIICWRGCWSNKLCVQCCWKAKTMM